MINGSDKSCRENQNTHLTFNNLFLKIVASMRQFGRIFSSRADHRWNFGACALHAGYL